ncbi:MAG: hypothetical protein JW738_02980 [Actinobacteria bacterium]|nr:hypothetical protein [Actinomycetota bacterium]
MALNIPKKRCGVCGLPRFIHIAFKWHDNGTITANPWPWGTNFRVVVIQSRFVNQLLDLFKQKLELPVDEIAFEAQRHSTMAVYKPFYDKVPGLKRLSRLGRVRHFLLVRSNEVAGLIGMCGVKTLEYVPGKYGVAEIKNPFNENLLAAITAGDFELLELKPYEVKWERKNENDYIFRVQAAGEHSEKSERMVFEATDDTEWFPSIFKRSLAVVPGKVEHDRCPKCGAPIGLARMDWVEDGVIIDTSNDSRVVFLDGYTINTITGELAKQSGKDGSEALTEIVREYTVSHGDPIEPVTGIDPVSTQRLAEYLMDFLNDLPLLGQGNPVKFEIEGLRVNIIVDNPYDVNILAGSLQGLYESIIGGKSLVQWQQRTDVRIACVFEPA